MEIITNKDLQSFNTMAVPCHSEYFVNVSSIEDLQEISSWLKTKKLSSLILGGGSNLILPEFLKGLTIKNSLMGKRIVEETSDTIVIEFNSGENWHSAVEFCVHNGYNGLENLALIPGSVGAAPIQNIGAYGLELEHVFLSLDAFDLESEKVVTFSKTDCEFGYRDSFFKSPEAKGFVILCVKLKLRKDHKPNIEYPALKNRFESNTSISSLDVFNEVIKVRQAKLPDPNHIPNCGSFFKNPIIKESEFVKLKAHFTDIPYYSHGKDLVKIPAAWLIDQLGWKGKSQFGVGVHANQALVLVNPNRLNADRVLALAEKIKVDVKKKFAISLEEEPIILL